MGTALTPELRDRREELEEEIDDARETAAKQCLRIGMALHAIKRESLYADDYDDFGDYVKMVWDFEPEMIQDWMSAGQIAENLKELGLSIQQLTIANALALVHVDDPAEVWSEVSAASPSPTAMEIEAVARLHLPLLSGAEALTKDEERDEIQTAEEEIDAAVNLGRAIAAEKKAKTKFRNIRKILAEFRSAKPVFIQVIAFIDEILTQLGD